MGALRITLVLSLLVSGCFRAGFDARGGPGADGSVTDTAVADVRGAAAADAGPAATTTSGGASDPAWSGVALTSVESDKGGRVSLEETPGFAVKKAELSSGRAWGAAAALGDRIYVIGGGTVMGTMSSTDEVMAYAPASDTLTPAATLPYSLIGTRAVTGPDDKIYVVMGEDPTISAVYEARVLRFDPSTSKVTTAVDGMYAAYHHAAALGDDGLIYAFAGYGSGPIQKTIEAFDPATDAIVPVAATLPSEREKLAAFAAPSGDIYLFGGALVHADGAHEGGQITDQILRFRLSPPAVSVVATAKLPRPLINVAGGVLSDGAIYLVGGDTTDGGGTLPTSAVLRFDPQTETLTTVADTLPAALSGAAAAVAQNGKLYLFGGRRASGLNDDILEMRPYASDGALLGPVIDTGAAGTACTRLDWTAQAPAGTTLEVSVRGSDAKPDQGAASPAWQTVSGPPATSGLPSGRYLQWRVRLTTSNSALTPTLDQISLSFGG